ncbi:hypothetical protein G7054_g11697 [Neopestalotiopsis clavispora]|nr:hypothetical protein G7054_g11697 [Neopestalotiopsis clavispora]
MQVTIRRVEMRLAAAVLLLATVAASDPLDMFELAERQTIPTTGGNLIEICPNQNYEGLNETITFSTAVFLLLLLPTENHELTLRVVPTVSLTYTPLRVGSPQGVSSARMFGEPMNCTLYNRENGFVIPATGASELPLATSTSDPYAMDDQTVAFNCKPASL